MIYSKAALGLVELNVTDKALQALNVLALEPDGSVAATNGKVLCVVSPAQKKIVDNVPLPKEEKTTAQIVLSAESVRTILKAIPKDTLFKGLLEHCAVILPDAAGSLVRVVVTDGKRKSEISVRRVMQRFPDYKLTLRNLKMIRGGAGERVILNRKRMVNLMEVLEKVCPYNGEFSPLFWQFTLEGDVVLKAENELTGQRLIAAFKSAGDVSRDWLEEDDWERKLTKRAAIKL